METRLTNVLNKTSDFLNKRKILRDLIQEFFNTGIGYIAGLVTYNYLSRYIEARSVKNLWGFANFKKKTLVSADTFEVLSLVISAVMGFIILKTVTYFTKKMWQKFENKDY